MTRFQRFLNQLAEVLEFKKLKPDEHGACLLVMNETQVPLLFEYDDHLVPNSILVSSPVSGIGPGKEGEVLKQCLMLNGGLEETLSKKPDDDEIYLHRRIHPDIHAKDLDPIVHQFVETVMESKRKLG